MPPGPVRLILLAVSNAAAVQRSGSCRFHLGLALFLIAPGKYHAAGDFDPGLDHVLNWRGSTDSPGTSVSSSKAGNYKSWSSEANALSIQLLNFLFVDIENPSLRESI